MRSAIRLKPDPTCHRIQRVKRQVSARLELDAVQRPARQIVQLNGHGPRARGNPYSSEKLQSFARRPVGLHARRYATELHFGTEGRIQLVRSEGTGVERASDE